MCMLQEYLLSELQHDLNAVGLTTAPRGLTAQDSKSAFLGGCVAPTWKRLDLEPALLFCSDTRSYGTFKWACLVVVCKKIKEEIHQSPNIIKIHLILLPCINSKNQSIDLFWMISAWLNAYLIIYKTLKSYHITCSGRAGPVSWSDQTSWYPNDVIAWRHT